VKEGRGRQVDLRQIEGFHAVMEARSVSHAARTHGISQPAVSALIGRLEKQLGVQLFTRERRRLIPTTEANLLFIHVSEALESLRRMSNSVEEISKARTGTLNIVAHPTSSISWLPPFFADFQQQRPEIYVRLTTRSSEVLRTVPDMFDVGIAEPPLELPSMEIERFRLRCVAALPLGHPLCDEKIITPKHLDGVPLIRLSRWQYLHHEVARTFYNAGARLNTVHECEFFATAISLVAGGLGVSIVEPISVQMAAERDYVQVREFLPSIWYEAVLFSPQERRRSILTEEFIHEFKLYIAPYTASYGDRSSRKRHG
jgi:DNA-binding transcriptional LysR family regulator